MEIKFKRGAGVMAYPSRGAGFYGRVRGKHETKKGVFIIVREDGTKRDVKMRPALLKLA